MIIRFRQDPRFGDTTVALNYRETSPSAVASDFYEKLADPDASQAGGTAVAVPGQVAGLLCALERYGTLDRATVIAPAIRAAEQGFVVDGSFVSAARERISWFRDDPARQERCAFVWNEYFKQGNIRIGDVVRNPAQAVALRLIVEQGASAFYEGDIAREIVRTVRADGGVITPDDLRSYRVATSLPLTFERFGFTFLTMPPPSSGGVALAQMTGMLEVLWGNDPRVARQAAPARDSPAYVHTVSETMKHAFADRARYMGDPAFVEVPVERLTSAKYAAARAAKIDPNQTHVPDWYGTTPGVPDDHGTSHFCVIDARGNAVASTETVNLEFGSLLAIEKYGIVLNDEMDDFLTRVNQPNAFKLVQSTRNLPQPGKRPLSSMTPTIVVAPDGRVELIVGASGGPRIITGTLQVILDMLIWGESAPDAVARKRFHHQWSPDTLQFERKWFAELEKNNDPLLTDLREKGHQVARGSGCVVQAIRRVGDGRYEAACDARKGGKPDGIR